MRKVPNALNLLNSLGGDAREVLERVTSLIAVPAGQTLFREGDPGDALYVVTSGSMGVYVRGGANEERLLALIGTGEAVGEMALLSGENRSATVKAIRDTELLRLSKTQFHHLLKSEPEFVSGLTRILVYRLRRLSSSIHAKIEPKAVAILAAHDQQHCDLVANKLEAQMRARGLRVKCVGREGMEQSNRWFGEQEAQHDLVFLIGTADDSGWTRLCARQADRILVVADGTGTPEVNLPEELLRQRSAHQLLDLVLLQDDEAQTPRGTDDWSVHVGANRHFHVRRGRDEDWARLSRVVTGDALGLVLSGGGARAFAQIGVVRALREAGIDFDFIGGTSMGGLIGAGLAVGWSIDETTERLRDAFVRSSPLRDLTIPVIGMVKGLHVERKLRDNFGERRIGDLWRPYFCVSSNLTTGGVHVHRRGRVRDALRASIALPGILPPYLHEEGVLVDGAATNNLPVDVMRNMHRGRILAVDVAQDRAVGPEMIEEALRGSWYSRLLRPPIVSILFRAATISSEEQDRRNAVNADLVMAPPLGDIEIRDWKAFDQAIDIGYEHGLGMISQVRKVIGRAGNRIA